MKENVRHVRHHNNTIFLGSTNCIILTPTPGVCDKTGGLGTIVRSSHIGGTGTHSNRVIRPIGWSSVWTMGEQLPAHMARPDIWKAQNLQLLYQTVLRSFCIGTTSIQKHVTLDKRWIEATQYVGKPHNWNDNANVIDRIAQWTRSQEQLILLILSGKKGGFQQRI